MSTIRTWTLGLAVAVAGAGLVGLAQEKGGASTTDPRASLKPGLNDAQKVSRNIELLSTLGKPSGFFDPKAPKGEPSGPERPQPSTEAAAQAAEKAAEEEAAKKAAAQPPAARPGGGGGGLSYANSDMAFSGKHMFVGNFHGFNTYDIESPRKPRLLASIVCPGGQGDVSVYGNLLFMSVEQTRGRVDCGVQGVTATVSTERFRGVRIFDITDLKNPKQVAAVQTCRGSHTHTLVTNPNDKSKIYVYGSGTGTVRPGEELAECSGKDWKEDPNTSLFSIDVIEVPVATPQDSKIVSRPRIFADPTTGAIGGLWQGGNHGEGTQTSRMTNQCHDITVYPEKGLAAGACSGNGILLDISDPKDPKRLDAVIDKNFSYWHSATFNNDGTKIIFTDEWGGGTRPRCRATDPITWGANAIFEIGEDRKLKFGGYYKIPAAQGDTENCVAHNGSLIPVPGRDIMVQAWYQGGVSVFDFTDPANAKEIAYFDRGPIDPKQLYTGGYWSAYWYNGQIYGAEIARGIDVFRLLPSEFLTKNEIDAATLVRMETFNAQEQPGVKWPASAVVARAYVDQLNRTKALPAARATAISQALAKTDEMRTGKEPGAAETLGQLDTLAGQLTTDAGSAQGRDAQRMKALAETLKGIASRLRG
jgi:hypothetical protein